MRAGPRQAARDGPLVASRSRARGSPGEAHQAVPGRHRRSGAAPVGRSQPRRADTNFFPVQAQERKEREAKAAASAAGAAGSEAQDGAAVVVSALKL